MVRVKETGNQTLLRVVSGEKFTPFSLCRKFAAHALLESASFGKGRGQYSILLVKKAFSILQKGKNLYLEREGKLYSLKTKAKDILDLLLHFANQHSGHAYNFPFPAGGIGYLSYEYGRHFDDVRLREKPDPLGIADACFIFGHLFLIFDHYSDTISILALNYKEHSIDLKRAVQDIENRIHDLDFNYLNNQAKEYSCIPLIHESEKERFLGGVEQVRREIIKGNLLQGVLSRRVLLRTEIPALEAYRRLRSLNPSPYMFYLNCKDFQLIGSSPEIHAKVDDRRVTMRPIAGTRKRGETKMEDLSLEKELLGDEKECAEHLMLVDLARNDLGRICKPGSVEVTEYMGIERYSHVMHIVSQVEGTLMGEKCGIDAIRKTFPAGTVSGAPKIKAMEIIDLLEKEKRGFYAGIIGYIEPEGTLDTCITIRSALKIDDLLVLQAGAGIVYDSVPENEYAETESKLKAFAKTLGVEV